MILFTRVDEKVFDKVATIAEGLVANITSICLGTRVSDQVYIEVTTLSE